MFFDLFIIVCCTLTFFLVAGLLVLFLRSKHVGGAGQSLSSRIDEIEERVGILEGYHSARIPYKASQQVEDALALTNQAYWLNEKAILQIRQDYEHITGLQDLTGKLQKTLLGLRDTSRNQSPPPLD